MRDPKGQAAIEYLAVFGIALLLSTPFIVKAQQSIFELRTGSDVLALQNSLDNLETSADTVVASGKPAKRTFDFQVSDSVESANVTNNSVIYTVRTQGGESDLVRSFDFNFTGEVPEDSGRHRVSVSAVEDGAEVAVVE